MKGIYLIPTLPTKLRDVQGSWKFVNQLREQGATSGLMLVSQGGHKGLRHDWPTIDRNLFSVVEGSYGAAPIVLMASNVPIEDIHFLDRGEEAEKYVTAAIEAAASLSHYSSNEPIVTFHLNTLVTIKEFLSRTREEWRTIFNCDIAPRLRRLANYAVEKNVQLLVETVPVPEFGDLLDSPDGPTYRNVALRDLRNPFYLWHGWGFAELQEVGLGICLDLCHSRTLYEHATNGDAHGVLFPEDLSALRSGSLIQDAMHPNARLYHLNNGTGLHTPNGGRFQEGLVLGSGDIGAPVINAIIYHAIRHDIPMVLEINERDYVGRPNLRDSIDYLTLLAGT